jgi:(p)ppGpp synthase/HD superfamily hydrolase
LHDVLEDTPYTSEQLAKKGFSKEIIQAVQLLTKNKNLSYADNIKNIINSGNKLAMMVKYSDNYMNFTGDKSHWDPDRAAHSQKKYLASLNALGDVLGITKHIGNTKVTENADYLEEK